MGPVNLQVRQKDGIIECCGIDFIVTWMRCYNAEANMAAQGAATQTPTRFQGSDEDKRGTQGPQEQATEGSPQAECVISQRLVCGL